MQACSCKSAASILERPLFKGGFCTRLYGIYKVNSKQQDCRYSTHYYLPLHKTDRAQPKKGCKSWLNSNTKVKKTSSNQFNSSHVNLRCQFYYFQETLWPCPTPCEMIQCNQKIPGQGGHRARERIQEVNTSSQSKEYE